ncbi:MAG: hypothetical protein M3R45_11215 [Pseudomonadota bacterium]|nr:hypothetical protein [Pseudomonadota bacterium]
MTGRLGHLRALLYLLALKGTWHWQLQEVQDGLVWVLVHEGGDTPSLVYALGETLSPQARAIACMHPGVMRELAATEEKSQEALERLQRLHWMLARLQRRIYKAGQREHYRDIRWAQVELGVVTRLLQADAMPTLQEMEAWEESLLHPDKSPKGV